MNKEKKAHIRARKYFGIYKNPKYVLHHVDVTLKERDPERYKEWRIDDLVVMTRGEHSALHNSIREVTEETRKKMGSVDHNGEHNGMYGKHHTKESREKMSANRKGKKRPYTSEEARKNLSKALSGKPKSEAHKNALKEAFKSRGNHWKVVDGKRVWY